MPEVTIRRVEDEQNVRETFFKLLDLSFGATPPMTSEEALVRWLKSHTSGSNIYVLYEDAEARACVDALDMLQNVRGRIMRMSGISSVATHPAGRRKGYARQLMVRLFEFMVENDYPISTLFPFRESFYERLGYVMFPHFLSVTFDPQALTSLLNQTLPGEVEMLSIADGWSIHQDFMQVMLEQIHGFVRLPDPFLTNRTRDSDKLWLAVARVEGEVVGIMSYHITGFWKDCEVLDFHYINSVGKYLLLSWLGRYIDQIKTINIRVMRSEAPETWWPDLDPKTANYDHHHNGMGRIIDVMKLNGIPIGDGEFTARISDEYCPWNDGVYRFASDDGVLQIEKTHQADCDLTIQALTALIYGTHVPEDFAFRGWGHPPADVQAHMQTMFSRQLPYMQSVF